MRFRLTIFLLLANAALFFGIWSLEGPKTQPQTSPRDSLSFTVLEIEGKSIAKPCILKLQNNKWRITSPIDWPANLFSVNRIKTQIEFLDKEANFSLDEVQKHKHSLSEYGLDDPAYVFKYGNGEKMHTLKIGKNALVGNRIYMLDEANKRIIVVDKEVVNNLIIGMEDLRNQMVFEIPRFEVSSFFVRLPVSGDGNSNFKRVGILREGGKWKFETPIVANADAREVDAFLNDICQLSASSFNYINNENTGLDNLTLKGAITLKGTNRQEVLLLGNKTQDGTQVYARLEDNPTVFLLNSSILKKLEDIQINLRDKSFLRFDENQIVGIDISKDGKSLKLRKLTTGLWDVIGSSPDGGTLTAKADFPRVNALLVSLGRVKAKNFVNDNPTDNLSEYGIGPKSLHIVATQSDQDSHGIVIGSTYKYNGSVNLMYACADGANAVYGIPMALADNASTDFLYYRSRILENLPENAVITSLKISRIQNDGAKTLFEISSDKGDFKKALSALKPRVSQYASMLLNSCRNFDVKAYIDKPFSPDGVKVGDKDYKWVYEMQISMEVPAGNETNTLETRKWYFSKRVGGTTQYGGSASENAVYTLTNNCIDAIFELTQEANPPKAVEKPAIMPVTMPVNQE